MFQKDERDVLIQVKYVKGSKCILDVLAFFAYSKILLKVAFVLQTKELISHYLFAKYTFLITQI